MKTWIRFGIMAALAASLAVPSQSADVTVGLFYVKLAQAKNMAAGNPSAAEAELRSAGYRLPVFELGQPLTEGDLTAIAASIGLSVTTSHPGRPIGEPQLATFMSGFAGQIGGRSSAGVNGVAGDPGNSGNGKGKKKGHNKSSAEPGD